MVASDDHSMTVSMGDAKVSTVTWLPFPGITPEQRKVLVRWLYSAADRETFQQRHATRTQDRVRYSIRANAFRDAIAELTEES